MCQMYRRACWDSHLIVLLFLFQAVHPGFSSPPFANDYGWYDTIKDVLRKQQ